MSTHPPSPLPTAHVQVSGIEHPEQTTRETSSPTLRPSLEVNSSPSFELPIIDQRSRSPIVGVHGKPNRISKHGEKTAIGSTEQFPSSIGMRGYPIPDNASKSPPVLEALIALTFLGGAVFILSMIRPEQFRGMGGHVHGALDRVKMVFRVARGDDLVDIAVSEIAPGIHSRQKSAAENRDVGLARNDSFGSAWLRNSEEGTERSDPCLSEEQLESGGITEGDEGIEVGAWCIVHHDDDDSYDEEEEEERTKAATAMAATTMMKMMMQGGNRSRRTIVEDASK
jgi:hypothetical protein